MFSCFCCIVDKKKKRKRLRNRLHYIIPGILTILTIVRKIIRIFVDSRFERFRYFPPSPPPPPRFREKEAMTSEEKIRIIREWRERERKGEEEEEGFLSIVGELIERWATYLCKRVTRGIRLSARPAANWNATVRPISPIATESYETILWGVVRQAEINFGHRFAGPQIPSSPLPPPPASVYVIAMDPRSFPSSSPPPPSLFPLSRRNRHRSSTRISSVHAREYSTKNRCTNE